VLSFIDNHDFADMQGEGLKRRKLFDQWKWCFIITSEIPENIGHE
jgi:hypothetical protein